MQNIPENRLAEFTRYGYEPLSVRTHQYLAMTKALNAFTDGQWVETDIFLSYLYLS